VKIDTPEKEQRVFEYMLEAAATLEKASHNKMVRAEARRLSQVGYSLIVELEEDAAKRSSEQVGD
jgi:hypothetical protein